jgi:hypothetical protein
MTAETTTANGDLAASTVTTITFDDFVESVVVENLAPEGTANSVIYGTADGTTEPTVEGANNFAVEPGDSIEVTNGQPSIWFQGLEDINNALITAPNTVIKLISASTPSYSVTGA